MVKVVDILGIKYKIIEIYRMNHWVETAIKLLSKSLHPVPQELNEIDWKSG
jgi:hypothetical protein